MKNKFYDEFERLTTFSVCKILVIVYIIVYILKLRPPVHYDI